MATLERIRSEETESKSNLFAAMPSRAKYFQSGDSSSFSVLSDVKAPSYMPQRKSEDYSDINIENEELKRDIKMGNPDILPTGATLKMLRDRPAPAKPFDDTIAVSYKVNAKGKLLFALYAVAVLSLILVIVLNAVAIEKQRGNIAAIENQILMAAGTVDNLLAEAQSMNNSNYIQTQAENLGMKPVTVTKINVTLPQFAKAEEIKPITNWFDWFCDIFI